MNDAAPMYVIHLVGELYRLAPTHQDAGNFTEWFSATSSNDIDWDRSLTLWTRDVLWDAVEHMRDCGCSNVCVQNVAIVAELFTRLADGFEIPSADWRNAMAAIENGINYDWHMVAARNAVSFALNDLSEDLKLFARAVWAARNTADGEWWTWAISRLREVAS